MTGRHKSIEQVRRELSEQKAERDKAPTQAELKRRAAVERIRRDEPPYIVLDKVEYDGPRGDLMAFKAYFRASKWLPDREIRAMLARAIESRPAEAGPGEE